METSLSDRGKECYTGVKEIGKQKKRECDILLVGPFPKSRMVKMQPEGRSWQGLGHDIGEVGVGRNVQEVYFSIL